MSLGENVRSLRHSKGWSQAQLSEYSGIRIQHLSRIEQDQGDLKISTVYKLIDAFGCTANALLMNPTPGTKSGAVLSLIFNRVSELPEEKQEPLFEILDKYCVACEMEQALTQTPRTLYEAAEAVSMSSKQEEG
ncbi:helix-turn-helix protein [Thiobaca trueperi]|uniref:Helix-turn-helix protein n=2 Tax=Thiobaca trueperi TaxID=127458 RepID=A0A4R3N3Y0_9GAMM|nr:helix-turn-helix protein [Thiobaca trueperi]